MRSDSFIPSFAARLQRNCLLLCGLLATCGLAAQSFPLSENTWDNPEFVDRFLGTYGVLTEREPKITTDEAELFEQITPLMQAENYEGAISLLQGALTAESSAAINYTIANIALQSGNYDLAEREYREAIRKFPNFLRAYKNLGLAYTQQSDFSQARDMFNRAIELGDGDGDTYGLVGYCYLNLNQMARARDAYAIARVLSPGNKDWVIGYAQSLMATRQFEQAISVFEELIAEEPGRGTYYTQIANAYISLADYPQAARYLEIIRRMGEANAATLGLLGDIYVNTGLFDLALTVFLEAYEVEGSVTAERSLQVASSLLQRGAYTEAETFLSQLEARGMEAFSEEQETDLYNLQAELAIAQGDEEAAVETLERVIELDPFNGRALLLLGEYYLDAGDPAQAIYYFELAQNIDAVAAEAFTQHARLRVSQREYAKAVELLERAQAQDYRPAVARYLDAVRRVMDAAR